MGLRVKNLFSNITTDNFIPIGDELIFGRLFNNVFDNIKY